MTEDDLLVLALDRLAGARETSRRIAESPTAPGLTAASLDVQRAAEAVSVLTGQSVLVVLGKAKTGFSGGHEWDSGAYPDSSPYPWGVKQEAIDAANDEPREWRR